MTAHYDSMPGGYLEPGFVPSGNLGEPALRLTASSQPSVVFSSLAAQCTPQVCDTCTIDVVDGAHARYRIVSPRDNAAGGLLRLADRAGRAAGHRVQIRFACAKHADPSDSERRDTGVLEEFCGVATFTWERRTPTRSECTLVSVLVDAAVQSVAWQRAEEAADNATATSRNLQTALHTSRRIGTAIGILVSLHKITDDQAFGLLASASQQRNRKLRDLALEVIDTGWLDPALDPDVSPTMPVQR